MLNAEVPNATDDDTEIQDLSDQGNHVTTVHGSAVKSTDQKKFGSASLYVPSSGSSGFTINFSDNDFNFQTEEFTIEFWMRAPGTNNATILEAYDHSDNSVKWAIRGNDASPPNEIRWIEGTTARVTAGDNNAWHATNWNHVAVVRASGTVKVYINGTADTNTFGTNTNLTGATRLVIGNRRALDASIGGYIDDLRIDKANAKYTANFTVTDNETANEQVNTDDWQSFQKAWVKTYSKDYTKDWVKAYGKAWVGVYEKDYVTDYVKNYDKDWVKTYTGSFDATYEKA